MTKEEEIQQEIIKNFSLKIITIFFIIILVMLGFSYAQQTSTTTVIQENEFINLLPKDKRNSEYIQLVKLLESSNEGERANGVSELTRLLGKEVIPILIEMRKDSSADVRNTVLYALFEIEGKSAIPYLREAFQTEQNGYYKGLIAGWLFDLGDKTVKEYIEKLIRELRQDLKSENQLTRIEAAKSLASFKDKSGVNILLAEGLFYNVGVVHSAGHRGTNVTMILRDATIRRRVAELLGELFKGTNDKSVIAALKKALNINYDETKLEMQKALEKIQKKKESGKP